MSLVRGIYQENFRPGSDVSLFGPVFSEHKELTGCDGAPQERTHSALCRINVNTNFDDVPLRP
jgi:hypothetical protein